MSVSDLLPTSRLTQAKHVHVRQFDGDLVVLDLKNGEYFALRDVGAVAWTRMADGKCLRDVAEEVATTHAVTVDVVLHDLLELGNEWLARGLVELGSDG